MNIILVFTNKTSWIGISKAIRTRVDWEKTYPNETNPITFYTANRSLQSVDYLSEEGVYLVYDTIDTERLRSILNQCPEVNYFALIHSVPKTSFFSDWDKQSVVVRGRHENDNEEKYYPLFDILTDDKPDKTNRIIKNVFIETVKANFKNGCKYPNNGSAQFRLALKLLKEQPDMKDAVDEFMSVYERSDSFGVYKEHFEKLKRDLGLS